MQFVLDVLAVLFISAGVFFLAIATLGFVRLPDLFCRMHVTGVIDTLGVPLVLLGIAFHVGPTLVAGKLILAIVFLYSTSPLVGHLLARAALEARRREVVKTGGYVGTVEADSEQLLQKYRYLK